MEEKENYKMRGGDKGKERKCGKEREKKNERGGREKDREKKRARMREREKGAEIRNIES